MNALARWIAALVVVAAFAGAAKAQQPEKVTLLLNFYLYSEHAPFFLGRERGYFKDQGIDLDIQEGRGSGPTVQAIAAGTAQFGYADLASMVKAAEQGAPLVAVGVLLQRSPMAVIGLAEKNVREPIELRGKSVAMTPGDSLSQLWPMFLEKVGLKIDEVTVVSGDARTKLNAVITGQADFMLGYLMDQNLRIEDATKKPVTVIPFSAYGVNLASSAVITSKDMAKSHGDLVRRFMGAATRSVEDAEKDPAAAVDAMLKAAPKAGDREALIKGLKLTIPLYHTPDTLNLRPFRISPQNLADSVLMLTQYAGVDKTASSHLQDLYTAEFLPN
jgi:NitT/TauT family transport system substrate-binding protein